MGRYTEESYLPENEQLATNKAFGNLLTFQCEMTFVECYTGMCLELWSQPYKDLQGSVLPPLLSRDFTTWLRKTDHRTLL